MEEVFEITGEKKLEISEAMTRHVAPSVASINVVGADEWGALGERPSGLGYGTGNYVELLGKPYILTNQHVAVAQNHLSLAHALRHGDDADNMGFRITQHFQTEEWPADAAIARIEDDVWRQGQRQAIPASRIARVHDPLPGERLFIQGFPGEYTIPTAFLPGNHATPVAFLTENIELPPSLDSGIYFTIHYSPERARANRKFLLPKPGGFSGSLVWDTRYVRMRGKNWSPECAVVTGLVRGWPQGEAVNRLLAVRIEIVRDFLLQALRREAAYFRYLGRQESGDDPLGDWLWAERIITQL